MMHFNGSGHNPFPFDRLFLIYELIYFSVLLVLVSESFEKKSIVRGVDAFCCFDNSDKHMALRHGRRISKCIGVINEALFRSKIVDYRKEISRINFFSKRAMNEDLSCSRINDGNNVKGRKKPLVIVIAGPTGVGKSDVAYELCQSNNCREINRWYNVGHIISADSVQAYEDLEIGANKPTKDEKKNVCHHLIDIISPSNGSYSAADWMDDTIEILKLICIGDNEEVSNIDNMDERRRKLIERTKCSLSEKENDKILPIIVGGTMMYIEWIIHGRPDAMKPTHEAIEKANSLIKNFQSSDDENKAWEEAYNYTRQNLPLVFQSRFDKLCGKDWYRLRRIFEVAFSVKEDENFGNDLYTGERTRKLSSLGYDVRCFFLCPTDRFQHAHLLNERCEKMIIKGLIQETFSLIQQNKLPPQSQPALSIGYRQTIQYLNRPNPKHNDMEAFDLYIDNFMTATRQYAKKQMSWFRKDSQFLFLPVNADESDKNKRVNTLLKQHLIKLCSLPRDEYDKYILQQQTHQEINMTTSPYYSIKLINQQQGKQMRTFLPKRVSLVRQNHIYQNILKIADECTAQVQRLSIEELA